MQKKTFSDISEKYDLEIDKIITAIRKQKSRRVLLQFPDGLKPYATCIAEEIEKKLEKQAENCEIFIWFGSCFGACDLPLETEKLGVDLIIQFGHSPWSYQKKIHTINK